MVTAVFAAPAALSEDSAARGVLQPSYVVKERSEGASFGPKEDTPVPSLFFPYFINSEAEAVKERNEGTPLGVREDEPLIAAFFPYVNPVGVGEESEDKPVPAAFFPYIEE